MQDHPKMNGRMHEPDNVKLGKAILSFESLSDTSRLTPDIITQYQTFASYYLTQAHPPFEVFELQALIHLANHHQTHAHSVMQQALTHKAPDQVFVSRTGQQWMHAQSEATNHPSPSRKYSGKIGGWLIFYAVTMILAACFLLFDFTQIKAAYDLLPSLPTVAQGDYSSLIGFAIFYDVSILLLLVVLMVFFFMKHHATRILAVIYHSYVILMSLILFFVLQDFADTYAGGEGLDGALTWVPFAAVAWLVYWIVSKRVKETFDSKH